MAEYLIQGTTLDAIADAINAKTGGSSAMTPAEMVTEIGSIPSGTTITDGIVVKARDANGYATEVDFYGTEIKPYQFGSSSGTFAWSKLVTINFKIEITRIGSNSVRNSSINIPIPPSVTKIEDSGMAYSKIVNATIPGGCVFGNGVFGSCASMTDYYDEQPTAGNYSKDSGTLASCTALQNVQIGSVGHAVTSIRPNCFANCRQVGLTVLAYTDGSHVDSLTTNIRSGATNATIIIKASENTTYNGTSYAAGDTILTSEVSA